MAMDWGLYYNSIKAQNPSATQATRNAAQAALGGGSGVPQTYGTGNTSAYMQSVMNGNSTQDPMMSQLTAQQFSQGRPLGNSNYAPVTPPSGWSSSGQYTVPSSSSPLSGPSSSVPSNSPYNAIPNFGKLGGPGGIGGPPVPLATGDSNPGTPVGNGQPPGGDTTPTNSFVPPGSRTAESILANTNSTPMAPPTPPAPATPPPVASQNFFSNPGSNQPGGTPGPAGPLPPPPVTPSQNYLQNALGTSSDTPNTGTSSSTSSSGNTWQDILSGLGGMQGLQGLLQLMSILQMLQGYGGSGNNWGSQPSSDIFGRRNPFGNFGYGLGSQQQANQFGYYDPNQFMDSQYFPQNYF